MEMRALFEIYFVSLIMKAKLKELTIKKRKGSVIKREKDSVIKRRKDSVIKSLRLNYCSTTFVI
jgi:hypothetical protein